MSVKNWKIFKNPFRSALLISTIYVIVGAILAHTDLGSGFAFWMSAPVSMPIFVLFGLNGSPSNIEIILATSGIALIYTAIVWSLIKITAKMIG
jgi:hypothetical protein